MKITTIECKSALNKSGIGSVDYVINPYVGCAHACVYCYADFMRRFTDHEGEGWGTFVDVKANIAERLRRELLGGARRKAQPLKSQSPRRSLPQTLPGLSDLPKLTECPMTARHATAHFMDGSCPAACCASYTGKIMFSSVTDPYQPLEAKWRLTRGCLEVLLEAESIEMTGFQEPEDGIRIERPGEIGARLAEGRKSKDGVRMEWPREIRAKTMTGEKNASAESPRRTISILTKSDLVTRDIDILKDFQDCTVGLTITTARDDVARLFEPGAPPPSRRLAALEKLNESGIKTWVFMGPVLPFFSDKFEEMDRLFKAVAATGTREILIDSMNFYPSVKHRINRLFARISQNGKHRGVAAYLNAAAHLNKIMHDPEGWRIDIKASAHKAANRWGIHVKFAF
ncbi:MAG TPA: radical SAM protein [Firmicutes bacterium]|nr:radical SAM protein [Bacillota bacterium]